MTRTTGARQRVTAVLLALVALGGCGLKGPLALPEKSERVIIRGPQGETPGSGPAPAVPAPTDEPPPPAPPLPGGKPGTSRGG